MPFVKLDTEILNSTLWVDREGREVFITALLMAEPEEFKEPMEQFEVGSMKTTGFVVPPGWYGLVRAAGSGIVRRAMVDHETGMEALKRLGSEDPESRSVAYGGRRLVRVNGGYAVLNYMKFRDRDYNAAIRQKNLRERKKLGIDKLIQMQDGKCACCESPFVQPFRDNVVRDHCHETQKNRGLICPSCNMVIGLIEKKRITTSPKKSMCLAYLARYGVT